MSRMCILVPQANFSDGGFAKLAHLARTIFFLFYFILFYLFFMAGLWVLWDCHYLLFSL